MNGAGITMITKVKWKNHSILGNLELDFTNSNGNPFDTIILAGENGTGKTTILETLSTFLNLGSIGPFEYIEYKVGGTLYNITPLGDPKFGFHSRKNVSDGTSIDIRSNNNNNRESIDADVLDIRHYGCAYSKARSGFNTQPVRATTTEQLDSKKYEDDSKDDFTFIKQLIVDIVAQDNSALSETCKTNGSITWDIFHPTSKIY
jgi:AAA15 family ATPase/GTPase